MKRAARIMAIVLALSVAATAGMWADAEASGGVGSLPFTEDFFIERCTFSTTGSNPYFVLEPGTQLVLEGYEGHELVRLVITVLNDTLRIGDVRTRVVEEFETADGEVVEVSRNYIAMCEETGNMFYFGEDVDNYEDGEVVSHDGSWIVGEDDARPGVLMPGSPMLGARYFQEIAPDVAMDRGEIVSMSETAVTPAGTFEGSLLVTETTTLEPNAKDIKVHAYGLGLVIDGPLFLVDYTLP